MVDTTDSKSVASNRVRVQVSSPVYFLNPEYFGIFRLTDNGYRTMVEPKMTRCRSSFFNGFSIVG